MVFKTFPPKKVMSSEIIEKTSKIKDTFDSAWLQDHLPIYYRKYFPFGPFFRWLNYGGIKGCGFNKREFSFTLLGDIYLRFQAFKDGPSLEKEVIAKSPMKIDIGAVYTHDPRNRNTVHPATAFRPIQRELVFDIDMTDYDEVRYCCQGADVCENCWILMDIAVKIIQRALTDDFGYEHILWVFSGRRGVHAWVCDESARILTASQRSAVAEYLVLLKGGTDIGRRVNLIDNRVHQSIRKAINIIDDQFNKYLSKQDILGNDERVQKFLKLLPDIIRDEVEKSIIDFDSSKEKWCAFQSTVKSFCRKNPQKSRQISMLVEEIQLHFCYPRIDIAVSKGLNHLLKAPFCVHPKTGKVCVPFPAENIIDPNNVPTLNALIEELDNVPPSKKPYRHSSMKNSVNIFCDFLKKLEKSRTGQDIENLSLDDW